MTDGSASKHNELHKVTVNLIPTAWDAANTAAALLKLSRTDVINRALQAYAFLEKEIAEGAEVIIRHRNGETDRLKFL